MNIKKIHTHKAFGFFALAVVALFGCGAYWVWYLRVAHSSFENYYAFRGCVELIEKTDAYGTCRISSGEVIKLVKFDGRWFLGGDLPYYMDEL